MVLFSCSNSELYDVVFVKFEFCYSSDSAGNMSDIFSAEGKDWFISVEVSSWLSNMISEEGGSFGFSNSLSSLLLIWGCL